MGQLLNQGWRSGCRHHFGIEENRPIDHRSLSEILGPIVLVPNSHRHAGTSIGQIIFSAMLDLFITHPIRSRSTFGGDLHFSLALLEYFLFMKPLFSQQIMDIIKIVVALPDERYRQRVQKRLTRLRKRLLAFVIKANPECFDHGGRLAPGCFPARIPPEATDLHGLMRRAECKLAMIRCHAECAIGKS